MRVSVICYPAAAAGFTARLRRAARPGTAGCRGHAISHKD